MAETLSDLDKVRAACKEMTQVCPNGNNCRFCNDPTRVRQRAIAQLMLDLLAVNDDSALAEAIAQEKALARCASRIRGGK